jgi:DoxX-like protein
MEKRSSRSTIAYWIFTLWVSLTAIFAGVADLLHAPPLFHQLLHLGYPSYFATLLGVWKVIGAIVLLAPRSPLLKEWAYAGMFIDYSSAVVSYAAVGGGAADFAGPLVAIATLAASWHLRPGSRRLTAGAMIGCAE